METIYLEKGKTRQEKNKGKRKKNPEKLRSCLLKKNTFVFADWSKRNVTYLHFTFVLAEQLHSMAHTHTVSSQQMLTLAP